MAPAEPVEPAPPPTPSESWVLGEALTTQGGLCVRDVPIPADIAEGEMLLVIKDATTLANLELPPLSRASVIVKLAAAPEVEGEAPAAEPEKPAKGKR